MNFVAIGRNNTYLKPRGFTFLSTNIFLLLSLLFTYKHDIRKNIKAIESESEVEFEFNVFVL